MKKTTTQLGTVMFAALVLLTQGCTHSATRPDTVSTTPVVSAAERDPAAVAGGRGSPAEYDAGPDKKSEWPNIFAETPNYRAYGKAIYQAAAKKYGVIDKGDDKFRWKVGPMWYRGRLTPESVKVFVIGQEGAQDENTSNRTFTGSTGTKMQNFINYFGIDRSYLFMNTFIYTITGQYGEQPQPGDSEIAIKTKKAFSGALMWLAQDPKSVVVQHRHRMFDYMLSQNKSTLNLVIGVGAAGKDSLVTWIKSHGGQCSSKQLTQSYCDASSLAPGVIAVGVMHPGAASAKNGGAGAGDALRIAFAEKAKTVAKVIQSKPNWFKPDPGMQPNFSKEYSYADASIPYRDFAFGTTWRMGKDGTSTNRRGADGIQIFSDNGCYNNAQRINGKCAFAAPPATPPTLDVLYDEPKDLPPIPQMAPEDLPWESPKSVQGRLEYDSGPGTFANLLMGQGPVAWPDFNLLGVTAHKSFGFGPIYRGDLENAQVLILGDQESHDDLLSTRALTGTGGQKLQNFLKALGIGRNYAIIRTLPVDTSDLTLDKVKEIALNPNVAAVRKAILDAIINVKKTKVVITVGPVAAEVMKNFNPGVPIINLDSPNSDQHIGQWQKSLKDIAAVGITPVGDYKGELTAIPRADLPSHTRWWMGTSGSRAARAYLHPGGTKEWNGDYYKFDAPGWVNASKWPADTSKLSDAEKTAVNAYVSSSSGAEPISTGGQ